MMMMVMMTMMILKNLQIEGFHGGHVGDINKEIVYLREIKFIFMQIFFTVLYLQLDRHENPLHTKLDSPNLYYLED